MGDPRRLRPRKGSSPIELLAESIGRLVTTMVMSIVRRFRKQAVPTRAEPPSLDEVSVFQPRSWPTKPLSARPPNEIRSESRSLQPRTSYKGVDAPLPYVRASSILSKGERAFWHPLLHAIDGHYRVFCKVRLADVVCCPPDRRDERRWFRMIGRYHVDFVVCDSRTTAPLLVVELDDRRHRERTRRGRDSFKDAVLQAAAIPILRIPAQQAYDTVSLKEKLGRLLHEPGSTSR